MGDMVMSVKERRRLEVLARVRDSALKLVQAAELMGLSYRQTKRVWGRYKREGDVGLIHRLRGRVSGRSKAAAFREAVLQRYEELYQGFGATLACEHLAEDGYRLDHETLRRWLIAQGTWQLRRRRARHRQWRERKAHEGELIQMDGSDHDWFEGRGPRAVLMVMIDDATNRTYARFYKAETTEAAMDCFERYARRYGLPQALYVDLDSIYRVNQGKLNLREQMAGQNRPQTQFERALKTLGVRMIPAYSPQARGRVERRNGVFQDRLVKELRLAGINTLAQANRLLDQRFLRRLNQRFTVPPADPHNLHRPLPADLNLSEVLSIEEPRTVARDWTIRWNNRYLQITRDNSRLPLPGCSITVRQLRQGQLQLLHQGQKLQWRPLPQRPQPPPPEPPVCPKRFKNIPAPDHPWRAWVHRRPASPLPSDEPRRPILGERRAGLGSSVSQPVCAHSRGHF